MQKRNGPWGQANNSNTRRSEFVETCKSIAGAGGIIALIVFLIALIAAAFFAPGLFTGWLIWG